MSKYSIMCKVYEVVVFFLFSLGPVCSKVNWYVQSPKIVLGGHVTLFCNTSTVQNSCKGCPTSWFGGENFKVLSYNGFTASSSKYLLTTSADGFGIIIKDFTEKDLEYPYKCSFGFHSFANNLTLDKNYEYQPSNDEIKTKHATHNSVLYVEIQLHKAHPEPNCTAIIDKKDISSELINSSRKIGLFYSVKLRLYINIKEHSCKGRLQILCRVGAKEIRVSDHNINHTCQDVLITTKGFEMETYPVILILLSLLLVLLLPFIYCLKVKDTRDITLKLCMQSGNRFKDNTPHSNEYQNQGAAVVTKPIICLTKIQKFPTDHLQDHNFSSSNNIYETKDNLIDSANFNSDEYNQMLDTMDITENKTENETLHLLLSDVKNGPLSSFGYCQDMKTKV
ncbi:Hypothetical predicted protein [Mytilus galloprovincialis]|uniref:Uncharacterized protein n=1 Tax=Mytilus galloprovincialis TaxID=29158 RepID=A0A8B6BY41_MYTGA|nr:Hypothetical predicted protein [Mytilus galloprovincialis]